MMVACSSPCHFHGHKKYHQDRRMQERQQVTPHCRAGRQNQNHQDLDLDDEKQDLEVALLHQLEGRRMPPGREVLINRRPQNHFDYLLPFRACRHIWRVFHILLTSLVLVDLRPF